MEGMNPVPHDIVLIVIFKEYNPSAKSKHVLNIARKILVGSQSKNRRYPSLPDKVNKEMKQRVVEPLYFSLIKPLSYGVRKGGYFTIGALCVYSYVGPHAKFSETFEAFKKVCRRLFKEEKYLPIFSFEVLTAWSEVHEYGD